MSEIAKHDDFCPCTRFHCDEMHCTCGAVETREIVECVSRNFAARLRQISHPSRPSAEQEKRA